MCLYVYLDCGTCYVSPFPVRFDSLIRRSLIVIQSSGVCCVGVRGLDTGFLAILRFSIPFPISCQIRFVTATDSDCVRRRVECVLTAGCRFTRLVREPVDESRPYVGGEQGRTFRRSRTNPWGDLG